MEAKLFIFYKSKETFCIRIFGWGIYGINQKAHWIPYSIKAGFKKLPIIKGYYIEFMIPLWLQKIINNIMLKRLHGAKNTYKVKPRRKPLK